MMASATGLLRRPGFVRLSLERQEQEGEVLDSLAHFELSLEEAQEFSKQLSKAIDGAKRLKLLQAGGAKFGERGLQVLEGGREENFPEDWEPPRGAA